jgi:hypothetical protein
MTLVTIQRYARTFVVRRCFRNPSFHGINATGVITILKYLRELELRYCPMVAVLRGPGVRLYETKTHQANNGSGSGG